MKTHDGWVLHKQMLLLNVLEQNDWNRTYAAESLGISLRGVRNLIIKMREVGIHVPDAKLGKPKKEKVKT